ncbi:GNAT family N-acetyltransferase [Shewanella baltica]|uniref:GNAT family N-acetyltransferase n=1 Tax=Shewanella baltica TaxID=62322 RepID=UPI0002112CC2|nr:GNAT family N-acetyltransferase [Shewanella baltica]AEH16193.1 hypothetical protein Sbal117_4555 [Shewanella baltica OS117]
MNLTAPETNEAGYADVFSKEPYIDAESDGERYLIHMLYVPPSLRYKGIGQSLFKKFLLNLPSNIKYLRLKSAALGSGDTLPFWRSLGFSSAYTGNDDASRILHLSVNGYALPPVDDVGSDERHYIFD